MGSYKGFDLAKYAEERLEKALAGVKERKQVLEALEQLEAAGVTITASNWDIELGSSIEVQRAELPLVRKVLGRMTMTGKDVADEFKNNEIKVSLRPVSGPYRALTLFYKTKLRAGGKCHVERSYNGYETVSLVCRK